MAEIQESGNKKGGKNKQKKMTVRVDFTPMVDMNMLLITFFMLCTSLSKPQTMEISMPSNDKNITEEQQTKVKASQAISSRSSSISKGARRAPQEIRIDFAVLPAANLYFLYCFTAKWSGLRSSKSAKSRSTGLWYSSSSSRASLALISSSSVVKFISSAGASYQM